ncbi:MAG: hypothetical protein A2Y39_06580 [Candidatus Delongbacteria bacterium GWF2_40_14]|nr:MAG: hypothetical protein A2Y39_06580 [Candidatus Delongbacteria bacterium GWF2_40_14]
MKKNRIKTKWHFEVEKDHPLLQIEKNKDESDEDHSKRVLVEYPQKWIDFVNKIKDDEYIYIVESYLLQNVLMYPHFLNDLDRQTIKEYSHKLFEISRCLNPVLIHLYQRDVNKSLRLTWLRRSEEWKLKLIRENEQTPYCKNRNLKDEVGIIQLWQDFSNFTLDLFKEYNYRKLQIENSEQDWINYRKRILTFLDLENFEEKLFFSSFRNFCAHYLCKSTVIHIHEENDRLCIDSSWLNLKLFLIPVLENEFEIEGYPTAVKFHICENTGKILLNITENRDLGAFMDGNEAVEYAPYVLCENKLRQFCGEYWCKADKLERKLYVRDGKLYYWRDDTSESQLDPITDTQFMMINHGDNRIDFKLVDGKWQFTFDVKGEKPTHSLFLRKEENTEKEKEKTE